MRKELLVSLLDIEAFCIECPNAVCRSQIRLMLNARVHVEDVDFRIAPLAYCPVCRSEFGDHFRRAVESLRAAITNMRARTPSVSLQIKSDALTQSASQT
jgi:hypothetical protein